MSHAGLSPDVVAAQEAADHRQRLAKEHRRLVSFAGRLQQGRARPGELTCIFVAGPRASLGRACFAATVRQAVREKYRRAGCDGVVRVLDAYAQALHRPAKSTVRADILLMRVLMSGSVRLAQHATRVRCQDADLFACLEGYQSLTSWLFQGADLRFRLHDATWPRLQLLLASWERFACSDETPTVPAFDVAEFPLSAQLRADILEPLPSARALGLH